MKIALVSVEDGLTMTPPMGLAYLATYLERKTGFDDTVIVDGNYDDVHKRLQGLRPDLIGISAMSLRYGKAIKMAQEIKKYSGAQLIIGGVHISTLPHSFNDVFDFGIIGEGEEAFREVVSAFGETGPLDGKTLSDIPGVVFSGNGGVRLTPRRPLIKDLDDIPIPDMKYVDSRYFRPREEVGLGLIAPCAPMMTARGCPYKCVFCSTSKFWDRYRSNSVAWSVENVRYLAEDIGVGVINILDDMFTVSKKRLRRFRDAMKEEELLGRVTFTCNARSNHIDDETCEILKEVGVLNLNFGFESGSERTLEYLKVGSTSVEKNKEAIRTCKRHGLVVYGSLMFGCPGETAEDMNETLEFIDFAKKEGADYIWSFVATPFPCTGFWEEAKQKGIVSDDMDWENEDNVASLHGNMDARLLADIDPGEFRAIFQEAQKKLRGMRYRLLLQFLKKSPLKAATLGLKNAPHYVKRFYYFVFRF